jgi:DUF971 family protein
MRIEQNIGYGSASSQDPSARWQGLRPDQEQEQEQEQEATVNGGTETLRWQTIDPGQWDADAGRLDAVATRPGVYIIAHPNGTRSTIVKVGETNKLGSTRTRAITAPGSPLHGVSYRDLVQNRGYSFYWTTVKGATRSLERIIARTILRALLPSADMIGHSSPRTVIGTVRDTVRIENLVPNVLWPLVANALTMRGVSAGDRPRHRHLPYSAYPIPGRPIDSLQNNTLLLHAGPYHAYEI